MINVVSTSNPTSIQTFTVTQRGLTTSSCTYTLNPPSNSLRSTGDTGSFTVSTTAGCSWTAVSSAPTWLNVTSSGSGSGPGPTTVNYSAAANPGPSRSGTISVGSQFFTLNQDANPLTPGGAVIGYGPGVGTYMLSRIEVKRTYGSGLTADNNIIAAGVQTYPANQTSFQVGWDFMWGTPPTNRNKFIETVNMTNLPQTITPTVNATLAATVTGDWSASGYGQGRSHLYQVDDSYHGVQQTILQGVPGGEDTTGTDSLSASYTKPAPAALNGEVRLVLTAFLAFGDVGNGRMEIDFVYTSCAATSITPPTQQPPASGGSLTVPVTATAGCTWSATVLAGSPWLTASPATGNGNGTVTLSATPNSGGAYRGGVVNIAGNLLAVGQSATGGSGSYTLNRIEVTRTYDTSVSDAANNPIRAGKQTFQGNGLLLSYQAGWDGVRPRDPQDALLQDIERNRFVSFLNFDAVPVAVTPGSNATVSLDMAGDWVAQGYGISRFHSLSASGAATGQAQTPTDNPDGTGPLAFTAAGPAQQVPFPDSNGEVRLVVNGRVDFSSAGGASIEADLVYTGGGTGPPNCTFTLSSSSGSVPQGGGTGNFRFKASDQTCAWTVPPPTSFLTLMSPASGTGDGMITYSATANSDANPRTGMIMVVSSSNPAGTQTFNVTQLGAGTSTCTFTLTPSSAQLGATGTGNGHLTFQVAASAPSCTWTPVANVAWLHPVGGSPGSGVDYTVDVNTGAARTGGIGIGSQTFTVNQAAATAPCTFTLGSSLASVPASGGPVSVRVTPSDNSCTWSYQSDTSWIVPTGSGTGTGIDSATFNVLPNTGPARTGGSATVAGQRFTINQLAAPPVDCTFMLTPSSNSITSSGATDTFRVNPASPSCAWTASAPPGFVSVTSSGAGTGTGFVGYSVAPNTGTARSSNIAVTIGTVVQNFTISQQAPPPVCAITLPVPGATAPAAGTTGSFVVNDGPTCTWTASFSTSWITPNGPTSGTTNGNVGYTVAANTGPARIGTIAIGDQQFNITQLAGASTCQFKLGPPSLTVQPGGGPGQVLVITDASCPWTATSNNPDFITVDGSSSGSGPNLVNFTVAANPGANARPGSLTIGSVNFPINELGGAAPACNITLSPGSLTAQPGGGPGQMVVTTPAGCTWTVSSTSWIAINQPGSLNGNGPTTVSFTVQPNTDTNARDGVITVGTQMLMVHQFAGTPPACTYSFNPASKSAAVTGGADSVGIVVSTGCAWTAISNNPDFLTVTTGSGSGNGPATVYYSVTPNTGAGTRIGTIKMQDQTFTVSQPGTGNSPTNPCPVTLSPMSQSAAPVGGAGIVTIGIPTGCAWQAISNNPDFITITTGASGSGHDTVFYTVQPNATGITRPGSLTIGGVMFPITQFADTSSGDCPLTLDTKTQTAVATGGPGQFMVSTQTGCTWSPVSNNPDFITISNAGSGKGTDTVFYNVAANPTGIARPGSISVGKVTLNITQFAAGAGAGNCSNESIAPSAQNAQPGGGTNQVTVTAPTGCPWTAVSNNPEFLNVTNGGSGSGNGFVTYAVAAYSGATSRSGAITIAGQQFTVTQNAAMSGVPCTYSFAPQSQSADGTGGPGQTIVSTNTGCAWSAASDPGWLTITTGATGNGPGLVNYSVGPYPSGAPRTGSLTLSNGNTSNLAQFQVMQTSGSNQACTFTLTPMSQPSSSAGGTGQVAVTVATGCTWTAVSNNTDFLTITAGGNGNGSGTLSYSVAANTGAQRMGTITVATGVTFTVTQDAVGANSGGPNNANCTYGLSQNAQSAVAAGGTSQFMVTSLTGCTWTAVSNNTDFLTVTSGGSGSSNGTVIYAVAPNPGANSRTGAITVGAQTFTLTQFGTSSPGGNCTFTLSPHSGTATSDAGSGQLIVAGPTGCAWSAIGNNPDWLTITNGASGNGNGSVTYTVAANTGVARMGSLTAGGVNYPVNQSASGSGNNGNGGNNANCNFSLSSTSQSAKAGGGPGQLSVTASSGCTWTAVSNNPDWLGVASGASGNGAGTISYTVSANTGANSRTGTITVANMTFQVKQDGTSTTNTGCNFSLNPASQVATSSGGSGTTTVIGAVGCAWTAVSANPDWINIVSGASGSGSGAFTYSVQPNTTAASRQGTVNAGGLQFMVNQLASGTSTTGGCIIAIAPSTQSASAAGGTGQVAVSTALGCAWTATSNADWLVVTGGGTGSGIGSVSYSVSANTGAARSGSLSLGGQMVTVMQAAAGTGSCSYSVPSANRSASAAGGADTVTVLAPVGCTWTSVPSADWITITSGGSGSGSGTVTYSAGANSTGATRSGNIAIAGQVVSITQSAPGSAGNGCTYSIDTTSQQATSSGGTGQVIVSAGAGCSWTATSSANFITILSGGGGSGNNTLNYTVAANTTGSPRMGTLTIAGQTLTVTQAAAGGGGDSCSYTINPSSLSDPGTGDSGQVLVIAPLGCSWLAGSSNPDWLSVIDSGTGQGNGVVTFGAAANSSGSSRIGTMTIGGQTLTISQNVASAVVGPRISVGGIVNAASFAPFNSPSGAIAQGSFFSIFGVNLGPATSAGVISFPLDTTLAGVSILISQGGSQVAAIPHFVSAGQINAILPSNAPLGAVLITVTYQGVTSNAVAFEVTPSNWGTFTNPAGGTGPGIIQNVVSATQYDLNTPSTSAMPGQTEIIWGTGLGAISGPDNLPPPVGSLATAVQVLVGGMPATIGYSGRTPCCSAVDNVYFTVPSNAPLGCAVPVQVILNGGNLSNTVTMAISQNGGQCTTNPSASR